jgi:hypothetical protein
MRRIGVVAARRIEKAVRIAEEVAQLMASSGLEVVMYPPLPTNVGGGVVR